MLDYNTQLKRLVLPEYGRTIQRMVDHCLTLDDRDERTRCAHTIVKTMKTLFPAQGNQEEYTRKLWDHLAIMADFRLDIDWPFAPPQREQLDAHPEPVPYYQADQPTRQYGAVLPEMIRRAAELLPGPDRDAMILLLANQMKKMMLSFNPEGVEDAKVFKDIRIISRGAIDLRPDEVILQQYHMLPPPKRKKKK